MSKTECKIDHKWDTIISLTNSKGVIYNICVSMVANTNNNKQYLKIKIRIIITKSLYQ